MEAEVRASLGTKIGVAFAVFMAVGSALAGIATTRQMSVMSHEAALLEGHAVLDALAVPAAVAIATRDYAKLDNFVAELERKDSNEVEVIVVVDHEGRLMATSRSGFVGAKIHDFDDDFVARALAAEGEHFAFGPTREAPEHLDIAGPIRQGQRWGTILARLSLASLNARLAEVERMALLITILSAVGGWLVAFLLLRALVIAPTRRLADMARRLGHNELDVRIEHARNDEIGALAGSLNAMAAKLKDYTSTLEAAVDARTHELRTANQALEVANRELERLATTDGLTGLRNHRYFRGTLDFELRRGARRVHHLVLCLIDIDHFKKYNDTHGHPAGDDVLRGVGKLLMENLRVTDVVARYGGEEFAIVLLDTQPDEGFRTAQKLGQLFRETPFAGEERLPGGKLTVSIGVAGYPEDARTPDQLVRAADLALYEAKRRGRDGVVRYGPETPPHTGVTVDVVPRDPLEPPIDGRAPSLSLAPRDPLASDATLLRDEEDRR